MLPDRTDSQRIERSIRAAPRGPGNGEDSVRGEIADQICQQLARDSGAGDFLRERIQFYLREVRGYAYDEVNAVLAAP